MAASSDGSAVYVTGYSSDAASGSDFSTIVYGTANGATLCVDRYRGDATSDDRTDAMTVGPDGSRVYVTGSSYGLGGTPDSVTISYAP